MAIEIKRTAPTQTFRQTRIGVVNRKTGGEAVYEQEARNFLKASNISFEFAKNLQAKEGQEFGRTVAVRDEKGELSFPALPMTLGRYGKDEANRIMQKRYLNAAAVDFRREADGIMEKAEGPEDYRAQTTELIKRTSELITKDGGGQVASLFSDDAYSYAAQQSTKLTLDRMKATEAKNVLNAQDADARLLNDATSFLLDGNITEGLILIDALETNVKTNVKDSVYGAKHASDRMSQANSEVTAAIFKSATKGMGSLEKAKVRVALVDDPSKRSEYPGEEFQAMFENYDNAPRPAARDKAQTEINQNITNTAAVERQVANRQIAEQIVGGIPGAPNNNKTKAIVDSHFAEKHNISGVGYLSVNAATPQGSNILADLASTSVLPSSLVAVAKDVQSGVSGTEYSPAQIGNLVDIWRNTGQNQFGGDQLWGEKTNRFLRNLSFIADYSPQNLNASLSFMREYSEGDAKTKSIVFQNSELTGKEGSSMSETAKRWLKKKTNVNPEHYDRLASITAFSLYSQGDSDRAEKLIENYYDEVFIRSPFLKKVGGKMGRDSLAPENYLDEEGLNLLKSLVEHKLGGRNIRSMSGKESRAELGKNVFLDPFVGGQATASYRLIDSMGNYLFDRNGAEIVVGPDVISKRRQKLKELEMSKVEAARDEFIGQQDLSDFDNMTKSLPTGSSVK